MPSPVRGRKSASVVAPDVWETAGLGVGVPSSVSSATSSVAVIRRVPSSLPSVGASPALGVTL